MPKKPKKPKWTPPTVEEYLNGERSFCKVCRDEIDPRRTHCQTCIEYYEITP